MATGSEENPIVQTNSGKVRGQVTEALYGQKYYYFDGIPYAQPPVGERRFRAPLPILKWPGIKDCTQSPDKCLQWNRKFNEIQGSEDCLYLNVSVKKLSSRPLLPVMVYIHGGGFNSGDATRRAWSPDYFMMKDVVFITIGYRLGMFGFASFSDKSLGVAENCGLLDVITALQWIQVNCVNFNGDPENITLFGHSSGSHMVHMLLQTPVSKGLFHKAILLAGFHMNELNNPKPEYRLAKHLGFKGRPGDEKSLCEFLTHVDGRKLVNFDIFTEEEKRMYENISMFPSWPTMDGRIIQTNPTLAQRSAWSNNIPLMMGSNSLEALGHYKTFKNDTKLYELYKKQPKHLLHLNLKTMSDEKLQREMAKRIKELHFADKELKTENYEYAMQNESYKMIYHDQHRLLQSRLKYASAPTYVYRFDFDSPTFNFYRQRFCGPDVRGVGHCDELGYIFYLPDAYKLDKNTPEYRCIEQMIETLCSFAKNSDPNNHMIQPAHWEPAQPNSVPHCLNVNYEWTKIIPLPEYETCCAIDEIYKMTNMELI